MGSQKTGTPGHQARTYREAIKEAKKPDVETVLLDRGYNRVLETRVTPNRRPDVLVVKKDGKIHPIEVKSRSDRADVLEKRNNDVLDQLPENMKGEYDMKMPTQMKRKK